jgi:transposase InsO family protein
MNVHENARLTPKGREAMVRTVVENHMTKAAAARQFNTTPKTVAKWVTRFREGGVDGLRDRSSAPHSSPSQTPVATRDIAEALRRERYTQQFIASQLDLSLATVSRILNARGCGRLTAIEPQEPRPRYERDTPGELIHMDIKRLSRFDKIGHRITGRITGHQRSDGAGYQFAHVAIDDHSRVARIDILPDEKKESVITALICTVAYFNSIGVTVDRVMTDNGSAYRSKQFARACRERGIKHIRTKPYTPQTNGKAERFIQTALREWAYATAYQNSDQRNAELHGWLDRYNFIRPHASLNKQPPFSRIPITRNNLLQFHS